MATVSVIIPCYNRATMVGETIQNMLDQTLPPDEIIVVDDGSTDNSAEVIASFGNKVKLIRQANQGPGAARNNGLKTAKGEFIKFMDSDDLASRNKLEVQLKALQRSGADFAYCPWAYCNIENHTILFLDGIIQTGPVPSTKSLLEWFVSGWSLVFQNCLFRRSILDKAGFYRTDLMPSEDSEYFLRILLSGARAVYSPECLLFYREHNVNKITASGTSSNHRAQDWTNYLEISGNQLQNLLPGMKLSTKIALVESVQSHLKYCTKHNLPGFKKNNPYSKMSSSSIILLANAYNLYGKFRRRIKGTKFYKAAFNFKKVNNSHRDLVTNMGYKVAGN